MSRLSWWIAGGALLLAALVALAAYAAQGAQRKRDAMQAWVPPVAAIPAWEAALRDGETDWRIGSPAPGSTQVERQIAAAEASLYATAIREREATGAAITAQVYRAAQLEALRASGESFEEQVIPVAVGEALLYSLVDGSSRVLVTRRDRRILILNANGLAAPDPTTLGTAIDAAFTAMARE